MMTQIVCAEAENFESMRNVLAHRIVLDTADRDDERQVERASERTNESNTKIMFSICFCYSKWSNSESISSCTRLPAAHTNNDRSVGQYEEQAEIFSDRR